MNACIGHKHKTGTVVFCLEGLFGWRIFYSQGQINSNWQNIPVWNLALLASFHTRSLPSFRSATLFCSVLYMLFVSIKICFPSSLLTTKCCSLQNQAKVMTQTLIRHLCKQVKYIYIYVFFVAVLQIWWRFLTFFDANANHTYWNMRTVGLCTCSESSSSMALSTGSRWVCGWTAVRVDLISGLMGGLLTWAFHSGDRRRRGFHSGKKIDKVLRKKGNKENNQALKKAKEQKRSHRNEMQLKNSYKKSLICLVSLETCHNISHHQHRS